MGVTYSKLTPRKSVGELVRAFYVGGINLSDSTQRAQANAQGYQRGVAEGIAALLFLERGDTLKHFSTIEPVFESDVRAILRESEKLWQHSDGAEKKGILDGVVDALYRLAVSDEHRLAEEDARREAVLAGKEKPLLSDKEWIDALVETKRREAEEIVALLLPVGNVNHPTAKENP